MASIMGVIEALKQVGALLQGHFVLTSGRHSDFYVNKDAATKHPKVVSKLCRRLADHFADRGIEVVVAPAVGGVILASWTAYHLSLNLPGEDDEVLSVYAERKESILHKALKAVVDYFGIELQPGEELLIRGTQFTLKRGFDADVRGKKVLITEDILTTGGSLKAVVQAVIEAGGEIVGACVLTNRGGVTAEEVGVPELFALSEIAAESWEEPDCVLCRDDIPVSTNVGKGAEYLARKEAARNA